MGDEDYSKYAGLNKYHHYHESNIECFQSGSEDNNASFQNVDLSVKSSQSKISISSYDDSSKLLSESDKSSFRDEYEKSNSNRNNKNGNVVIVERRGTFLEKNSSRRLEHERRSK